MRTIRVGNGCGFWGDNMDAPIRLAEDGELDYLTLEYLAELTLSIMAHQRQRDPAAGYATDFIDTLRRLGPILRAQPRLKIITNAGGINPMSCAEAVRKVLREANLADTKIAVVTGDDLVSDLVGLVRCGHGFNHLDTGQPLEPFLDRVVSANAYLGADPIVTALEQGARIVVAGRVADVSLTVAPARFEFGWRRDDWPRIAGAAVAGHLIECGAQVTGGLYCNWPQVPDYARIGYPIAVIAEDGSSEITKPPGSGGVVDRHTVIEQLLYEIGDPSDYLTPDVRVDFTGLSVHDCAVGARLEGAAGRPPTDSYKVSVAYRNGFMASGMLGVTGIQAVRKARKCGEIVLDRIAAAGATPDRSHIEVIGKDEVEFGTVVLRIAVQDSRREVVDRFCRELAPLVTAGPPGVSGYAGGRPQVREVLAYWPALIDRAAVVAEVKTFES